MIACQYISEEQELFKKGAQNMALYRRFAFSDGGSIMYYRRYALTLHSQHNRQEVTSGSERANGILHPILKKILDECKNRNGTR